MRYRLLVTLLIFSALVAAGCESSQTRAQGSQATPSPAAAQPVEPTAFPTPSATSTPWVPIGLQFPAPVVSLASPADNRQIIYALLDTYALSRSSDGGKTWTKVMLPIAERSLDLPPFLPTPLPEVRNYVITQYPHQGIWMSANGQQRIYVLAGGTLVRSDDFGETWRVVNENVWSWTVSDRKGDILYVFRRASSSAEYGFSRSDDGGLTWRNVYNKSFPSGLPARQQANHEGPSPLATDLQNPEIVYAGTDYGIYRSRDGGRTWSPFDAGLPPTKRTYRWGRFLTRAVDGTIYCLTETSDDGYYSRAVLARLQPGDNAWTMVGNDTLVHWQDKDREVGDIEFLLADPARPDWLYAGTRDGLLLSSKDRGISWQSTDLPQVKGVFRAAVGPVTEEATKLYLWTDQGFLVADVH